MVTNKRVEPNALFVVFMPRQLLCASLVANEKNFVSACVGEIALDLYHKSGGDIENTIFLPFCLHQK